jgi:hypothetical protein
MRHKRKKGYLDATGAIIRSSADVPGKLPEKMGLRSLSPGKPLSIASAEASGDLVNPSTFDE